MNTTCSECCNKEITIKKLARGVEKNEDKSNIYLQLLNESSDTGYELSFILPNIIDRHYEENENLIKEHNAEKKLLIEQYEKEINYLKKEVDDYKHRWLYDLHDA